MKYDIARIQKARILKGWSRSKLAEIIGKDPSTISALELGKIDGMPATIKAISEALEIPMGELLIEDVKAT
ncbi:MAG: helix-turn-helix transcriptional regulator [Anaerolineales bacterium]|nr:helix-turn-helix transcriptional regulator [Anaerolineales bacterium]